MAEYISKDQIHEITKPFKDSFLSFLTDEVDRLIDTMKPADVQPVKHGKNLKEEYPTLFQCSVCGCEDWDTSEVNYGEYNYCPNCGARMDGGNDSQQI